MSRLVDRRPTVVPPLGRVFSLSAIAGAVPAVAVLLAPRRLLGWVAVAGAPLEPVSQRGLVHPPG